jgi:Protein of unknown function (DUF3108)
MSSAEDPAAASQAAAALASAGAYAAVSGPPQWRCKVITVMTLIRSVVMAALLSLSAGAPGAQAAEADRVDARFEIYGFAGFHVLTNRTKVEESGDRYAVTMDLDTRGLASVFVNLTSHSQVHGSLGKAAVHPEAYHADVLRNGVERHYRVDYRGDGTVINASVPPPSGPPFVVGADQIHGTVDQLTAYFLVEHQLARRGTCTMIVPVFDGSGLYNLRFTDLGPETLSADGYQVFSGPSEVCEVVRQDILVNPNRNEDTYQRGKIWYARIIAGDRMLPVRMEFDTAFGIVHGYLAELHGPGADLRLARE